MTEVMKQEVNEKKLQECQQPTVVPPVDIWESDDEMFLYLDIPGVNVEDLDIRFEDQQLVIHGRGNPGQDQNGTFIHREYGKGDFCRMFKIGDAFDVDDISATLKNGELMVRLPKSESIKPRKIDVKEG